MPKQSVYIVSPAKDRGIKGEMVAIYFWRNTPKVWNQISAVFSAFQRGRLCQLRGVQQGVCLKVVFETWSRAIAEVANLSNSCKYFYLQSEILIQK